MYYERVLSAFQKSKVKYLIVGGMAVNLHGVPRFTKDLDIMVETSPTNLKRLVTVLTKLHYRPRVPVNLEDFLDVANWKKWHQEKQMIAFTLFRPAAPFEEIDVLIHTPITYAQAAKEKVRLRAGKLFLNLVSVKDLIKMKKKAGRAQDQSDVAALKKIQSKIHEKNH